MFVLAPVEITDAVLSASSLAETEHTAWSSVPAFAVGERVRVVTTTLDKSTSEDWALGERLYWSATLNRATTTVIGGAFIGRATAAAALGTSTGTVSVHGVYEAVAAMGAGTSPNPVSDVFATTPKWVRVGATNKWKPFDDTISAQARSTGTLTYTLAVPSRCTGLAFFNLAVDGFSVVMKDPGGTALWSTTRTFVDPDPVDSWLEYFSWDPDEDPPPEQDTEALVTGFNALAGYTIELSFTGSAPRVGEIVLGFVHELGRTGAGTEVGLDDFSRKERDSWGNVILIERDYSQTATFRFLVQPVTDLRRVMRIVAGLRARPAVWFAGADLTDFGATIYGFPAGGLRVPLEVAGGHIASLEIEGLT